MVGRYRRDDDGAMDELWSLRRGPDVKIAGVCGALAERWQVDPLVVRIAAVVLGLSAGVGVVLYAFVWALTPAVDQDESPVQHHAPKLAEQSREFWVAAAVVATVVVAFTIGSMAPLGLMPALVVLAVWYFGFRRPQQQARRDAPVELPDSHTVQHDPFVGPPTPFTVAAREWQQTVLQHRSGAAAGQPGPVPPTRPPAAPPRPSWAAAPAPTAPSAGAPTSGLRYRLDEPAPGSDALSDHTASIRSYLNVADPAGLYAPPSEPPAARPAARRNPAVRNGFWAGLLVAVGVVAAVDLWTSLPVGVTTYLAASLLVAALSLVAAAFLGRFRGQALLSWLLLGATAVSAVPQTVPAAVDWHSPTYRYASLAELPPSDHLEVGSLTVDLSQLDVTTPTTYRVSAEAGRIELRLPPGEHVEVRSTVEVGSVVVDGHQVHGTDLAQTHVFGPGQDPLLVVEAGVEAGSVEVVTSR